MSALGGRGFVQYELYSNTGMLLASTVVPACTEAEGLALVTELLNAAELGFRCEDADPDAVSALLPLPLPAPLPPAEGS
jgi:hypothetical protein